MSQTLICFMLRRIKSPILGVPSVLDGPLAFLNKITSLRRGESILLPLFTLHDDINKRKGATELPEIIVCCCA